MSELTKEQKIEVEEVILAVLKNKPIDVIREVMRIYPEANQNQISGVLSGMKQRGLLNCKAQEYCYEIDDDNTSKE